MQLLTGDSVAHWCSIPFAASTPDKVDDEKAVTPEPVKRRLQQTNHNKVDQFEKWFRYFQRANSSSYERPSSSLSSGDVAQPAVQ